MAAQRNMKHEREFPFASFYKDRHGARRWRVRKNGKSIQLGTDYGSDAFKQRYAEALVALGVKKPRRAVSNTEKPETVRDFINSYYALPCFKDLAAATRKVYKNSLDKLAKDRGDKILSQMERHHLQKYLDTIEMPGAANMMLKVIKTFLNGLASRHPSINNVTIGIKDRPVDKSFHCWTEAEIATFRSKHPEHSTEWRAMTLILWTGAARVDAVELGPKNLYVGVDGELRLSYKRGKSSVVADMPVSAELKAMIDALPSETETFLAVLGGKKRSANGLGNTMRDACKAAEIPKCSSHGLRKALGRRLAQAGATSLQIMAVLGHKSLAEAERYTRAYQREEAATEGMRKLETKYLVALRDPQKGEA
jgi:integrase